MKKGKQKDYVKDIINGIAFFIPLWLLNVFIAFVPFSRDSNSIPIIISWIVADALLILALIKYKYFNKIVAISVVLFFVILIGLYFIPLNSNIPNGAVELNNMISQKYENKYDYAKALFYAVEEKYSSPVRQYLLEPWKVFFIRDFDYYWNLKKGEYADSSIQGQIYRKLLLASGRFSENEVLILQSFCSNTPHLEIVIIHPDREPIYADLWAVDNFPASWNNQTYKFGMRAIPPCDKIAGTPY